MIDDNERVEIMLAHAERVRGVAWTLSRRRRGVTAKDVAEAMGVRDDVPLGSMPDVRHVLCDDDLDDDSALITAR
jgi:hypothetical protein